MTADTRVLYCRCDYAPVLPPEAKREAGQALNESGLACDVVPDLCELAARKSPLLAELAAAPRLVIAACHRRAVTCLFAAGGAPLREENVVFLDLRQMPAGQIRESISALADGHHGAGAAPVEEQSPGLPAWQPWFPVIDSARCENCGQCLGFCLFGVYKMSPEGRVEVASPESCKTGCPACARVCPSGAIVFPKYPNAPINGGDVMEGAAQHEPVQVDKAALLNGDILKVLQQRGKDGARFAPSPGQVKAMQERLVHLGGPPRPLDAPPGTIAASPQAETETE
jgi:NAD-dependent dihydropyrimidine dehydrogenase PreA subunit